MSTVSKSSEPQLDREALAALYEETFKNLEEGTITEGRVVALTKDKVVVDIGYKSEGMIPTDQFSHDDLQHLKIGDRIQVYIEECEDADGNQERQIVDVRHREPQASAVAPEEDVRVDESERIAEAVPPEVQTADRRDDRVDVVNPGADHGRLLGAGPRETRPTYDRV